MVVVLLDGIVLWRGLAAGRPQGHLAAGVVGDLHVAGLHVVGEEDALLGHAGHLHGLLAGAHGGAIVVAALLVGHFFCCVKALAATKAYPWVLFKRRERCVLAKREKKRREV
ncbi:Integral membrane protein [Balamuthia mandrillaris]